MAYVRSIAFSIPGKGEKSALEVYVEEKAGELVFTVKVAGGVKLSDLRGLFFDVNDDSKLAGMTFKGGGGAIVDFDTVDVIDLGQGANMRGHASPFDVGLEFGTPGRGKDVINGPVTFTLTNTAKNLTLDDIAHTEFGARMTSQGAKITTVAPAAPDAKADSYTIFEDGQPGLSSPSATSRGVLFEVLANDTDADGQKLTITAVKGAAHGTVQIVDGADADTLPGDAILYTPTTDYAGRDSFTYAVSDGNGGTDFATAKVVVRAVADRPDLDVVVSAGSAVNKVLVTVTATQTDDDSSEYIDRIGLGALPAGVTATPARVNPTTQPDQLVQVFELTLPTDRDVDFDLKIVAFSKETSNGDEQRADETVDIRLNHTATRQTLTFTADDQSIWNSGDAFTFVDDRFLGIDTSWNESGGDFVEGATDGRFKAGVQSTLTFNGGKIDASAVFDVAVDTLYNKTTDVLLLTASNVLKDLDFDTTGPTGSYTLDLIFDFLINARAELDFGALGKPDLFSIKIDESFDVNLLDLTHEDISPTFALPLGFSLGFEWPSIVTSSGPVAGGAAASNGASNNFLQLNLDVDEFLFGLLGVPSPLGIGFDIEVASGGADLAYFDLHAGMNFIQDFLLTINSLVGTLTWEDGSSQAFSFDQDILLTTASAKDANKDGSISYTLVLTPDASLLNETSIGFNFGYEFGALRVYGTSDLGSFQLGPLFSVEDEFPIASVEVYATEFDFNFGSNTLFLLA